MKKGLTELVFVLDASGSMQDLKAETISSFNKFIEDQKKVVGELKVTLATFNDHMKYVYNNLDISKIDPLSTENYVCNGYTALLYACVKSIDDVGSRLAATPEDDRPENIIFVIMTDGGENASGQHESSGWGYVRTPNLGMLGVAQGTNTTLNQIRELKYTSEALKIKVEHQTNKYSWKFVFLGANQDAFGVAKGMGIGVSSNYNQQAGGVMFAMNAVSSYASCTRSTGVAPQSINADQKVELKT